MTNPRLLTGASDLPLTGFAAEAEAFAKQHAEAIAQIEARLAEVEAAGPSPLWEGYWDLPGYKRGTKRRMSQVRPGPQTCLLYAWLAATLRPASVVEVGAAFGTSAMYWLLGLQTAGQGHLFAFEPNADWAHIAERNMAHTADRFTLITDTFEARFDAVTQPPALALIDAIHVPEHVRAQLAILRDIAAPGAVVVIDDITFSNPMKAYWRRLVQQPYVAASWQFGARTGIIQLV